MLKRSFICVLAPMGPRIVATGGAKAAQPADAEPVESCSLTDWFRPGGAKEIDSSAPPGQHWQGDLILCLFSCLHGLRCASPVPTNRGPAGAYESMLHVGAATSPADSSSPAPPAANR